MDIAFLKSAFRKTDYPPPDRPEIAFAGRSNVGKSSLINVLVKRKGLARTSSKPGRTQAINFFNLEDRLFFVDLPGYGFARVPLHVKKSWGRMVETYLEKRNNLKAVVVILDIRRDLSAGDKELLEWLNYYGKKSIVVLTKADKLSRQKANSRAKQIGNQLEEITAEKPTLFSAKTREGREEIWEKINRAIKI
ncbi:MAG: GTP-binding protein [Nitrospira bacterium SG8_3]|nr:MAG: GTP-binding protein [Nitrospira bacterium SG8_3]